MIQVYSADYEVLMGKIDENLLSNTATCIGQCTGCMCNCRCSCSGGVVSDFEWENSTYVASDLEYFQLTGVINSQPAVMARCACVACNSCTCACSCRAVPQSEEIEW